MSMNALPNLPCLCSNFRRTTRALSLIYEEAMRPIGLKATQFTILQALSRTGEITQGRLGEILIIDSTSLTRTLAIMVRKGWVGERRGKDRRERWIQLTKSGKSKLAQATRLWERVQSRLKEQLGVQTWDELMRLTHQVTTMAAKSVAD
jgi:DNA-binding MarR family transcriptional regulator